MRDSTVLPELLMLPTSWLVPHEDSDPRRVEKLAQRLRQEGRLKNPPIITPIPGTERYVVLDGANRSNALAHLDAPHIRPGQALRALRDRVPGEGDHPHDGTRC